MYGCHPAATSYERHIRPCQMMYMIPSRRALAYGLPAASVANSHTPKAFAIATSEALLESSMKSRARPSLCSLVATAPLQARQVPNEVLP